MRRTIHWLLLAAAAGMPGCSGDRGAPSPAPAVQLVETVPVETSLGHGALPATHEVWLDLVENARERLDFEGFYLSTWPGGRLEPILDAIGRAASRGVAVRILLDRRMHATYPEPADSLGAVDGIEVRTVDFGAIAGGTQHAKYFLVDDHTVFLGSQNFDWRALEHIHELGVRIRDARLTAAYRDVFEMDWAASGEADGVAMRVAGLSTPRDVHGPWPARLVQAPGDTVLAWPSYSPRGFIPDSTRWDRDAIVRLLEQARHEVVVQLLSYAVEARGLRDTTLDAALRRAAARGVRVRILVSDWQADGPRIRDLQSLAAVPNIEARLSRVPEWSGGYIAYARVEHCKFAVADTAVLWLGTSNWGPGYWLTSRNIGVVFAHRGLAGDARRTFEASWNDSNAEPVVPGRRYTPRIHGEDPPPGAVRVGG